MTRRIIFVGVSMLVMLEAVACGDRLQQPSGLAPGSAGAINVTEQEWSIRVVPDSVTAGTRTFTVSNSGTIEHNFVIQELDLRAEGIQAGQTRTVSAALRPGTYTIVCDIPGHAEAGMKTTLTVK